MDTKLAMLLVGATLASVLTRQRMSVEQLREILGGSTPPAAAGALPVVTFTEGVTFHWNDENIRVFHVEHAHTDGDVVVIFENANVVHMGDTFFNGRYPFIDVDTGGSIGGMIAAANRVLGMVDSQSRIIPGHGSLASPDDLQSYRDMLVTVRDRLQRMINDGMTVDEVVAANVTSDLDGRFAGDAARFVRLAYMGMTR